MNDRPTFYFNNDDLYPIRAGGVMFYYKHDNTCDFLMIYCKQKYEDFGGRTDKKDSDIIETISREVSEESNNVFTKEFVKEKISDSQAVYIKISKYLLYFIELNEYYDTAIFGNKETHDNIQRTVEWVPYKNLLDQDFSKKLNFRVTNYSVINKIKSLVKNFS